MELEEKYKLALFAVIRNSSVMPAGVRSGKNMTEINTMSVVTMTYLLDLCNFDELKKDYESVLN